MLPPEQGCVIATVGAGQMKGTPTQTELIFPPLYRVLHLEGNCDLFVQAVSG